MDIKIVHVEPANPDAAYTSHPHQENTVLFMTSNPKDTQVLNLNKEFNEVQDAQEKAKVPMRLRVRLDVGRKELLEILLMDRPSILHFSGHGTSGEGLIFQNPSGYSELVAPEALANLLGEFAGTIQCVVLNACYSEAQAQMLARHIPNVIGTDNAIGDEKAVEFSRAFYMCLFQGESYESAFRKAIANTGVQELSGGAKPVLYRWAAEQQQETKTQQITVPQSNNKEEKEEYFTDPRDGQSYFVMEIGGLKWLADNFNYDGGEGCFIHADDDREDETCGRLYTWAAAHAVCPEGWRLPTREDWKTLFEIAGGCEYYDDKEHKDWITIGDPKKAFDYLLEDGDSHFEIPLAGDYDTEEKIWDSYDEWACFWTATNHSNETAWYAGLNSKECSTQIATWKKSAAFSVRYVKDI